MYTRGGVGDGFERRSIDISIYRTIGATIELWENDQVVAVDNFVRDAVG
jgi:hypothetical protein